jgi:hypothetical protein
MERELPGPLDRVVVPSKKPNPESESGFGEVTINFAEMTAFRKGQPVALTALEFKTLKYLIQNARRVISREELLNEVWGYENYPCTRTVDPCIFKQFNASAISFCRRAAIAGRTFDGQLPRGGWNLVMSLKKSESKNDTNPRATEAPCHGLTESEVIQRAQGGNTAAFEYLYTAHSKQVYSVCLRMLRNTLATVACVR